MSKSYGVKGDDLFERARGNPILTPERWPYRINAVMNAAATTVGDETLLLCRVEDRRGFSHLTIARSPDGVNNWVVEDRPFLEPSADHPEEQWGVEDPRITRIDELDAWVIAYTAFGPGGPAVARATTTDFVSVKRLGVVCSPEDKNASLLPRRVNGEFVMFHRPVSTIGGRADVWISRSVDLHSWSAPEPVFGARPGGWWDSARIGVGPPPIETPHGWLVIYHGVRQTVAGAIYRAGLALLDLENPAVVLKRSDEWVLSPVEDYELSGDVPGVVFPCGLIHDHPKNQLRLYYGAADCRIGLAVADYDEVMAFVMEHG
ncbi:MAG: glycosidase [Nakamurella sp.]